VRIIRVELVNFRCLRNVSLPCAPLTALLGANGSGKSSVIKALEFFFLGREVDDLDCSGGGTAPISVAVTLAELPPDWQQRLRPWLDDAGRLRLERIAEPRGDGRRTSRFQSSAGRCRSSALCDSRSPPPHCEPPTDGSAPTRCLPTCQPLRPRPSPRRVGCQKSVPRGQRRCDSGAMVRRCVVSSHWRCWWSGLSSTWRYAASLR